MFHAWPTMVFAAPVLLATGTEGMAVAKPKVKLRKARKSGCKKIMLQASTRNVCLVVVERKTVVGRKCCRRCGAQKKGGNIYG